MYFNVRTIVVNKRWIKYVRFVVNVRTNFKYKLLLIC